jgi:hypothetical protein
MHIFKTSNFIEVVFFSPPPKTSAFAFFVFSEARASGYQVFNSQLQIRLDPVRLFLNPLHKHSISIHECKRRKRGSIPLIEIQNVVMQSDSGSSSAVRVAGVYN